MIREYKTVEEISGPLMMVRMVENVTYESSRPDVAYVTERGEIRAFKGGTTLVSVYWTGPYTPEGQKELLGEFWLNVCRRGDHDSLARHEIQWYEESCLIAHALGNAGEYKYTGRPGGVHFRRLQNHRGGSGQDV